MSPGHSPIILCLVPSLVQACGMYYNHIMIVNDASRVVELSASDAPNCGIIYDRNY